MKRPWNRRARPREPRPLTRLYDPVEGNLLPFGLGVGDRSGGTTASGGRSPPGSTRTCRHCSRLSTEEPTSGVAACCGRLVARDRATYILGSHQGDKKWAMARSVKHRDVDGRAVYPRMYPATSTLGSELTAVPVDGRGVSG